MVIAAFVLLVVTLSIASYADYRDRREHVRELEARIQAIDWPERPRSRR